jgi:hypothetical protein
VSEAAVTELFAVGAALLALWTLVRYPRLGPKRLGTALVAAVAAVVLEQPLLGILEAVRRATGAGVALLVVGLPLLTLLFWASGCVIRAAAGRR